jgi:hypothetical protein
VHCKTQGRTEGHVPSTELSPAPHLDWAPGAGLEPVRAGPKPGPEPHVRAFGPIWD